MPTSAPKIPRIAGWNDGGIPVGGPPDYVVGTSGSPPGAPYTRFCLTGNQTFFPGVGAWSDPVYPKTGGAGGILPNDPTVVWDPGYSSIALGACGPPFLGTYPGPPNCNFESPPALYPPIPYRHADPADDLWWGLFFCSECFTTGECGGGGRAQLPRLLNRTLENFTETAGVSYPPDRRTGLWWSCYYCPPGFTYYPQQNACLNVPCPPDRYWCELTKSCVVSPPPRCAAERGCTWSSDTCRWSCGTPTCGEREKFDLATCLCVGKCRVGQCWCEREQRCVDCDTPCKAERDCGWNAGACRFDCNPLDSLCPPGQTFSLTTCACEGECPEGQEYCRMTASCVDSPKPPCFAARKCKWNPITCTYDCESTATICGPGRTWHGEPDCNCSGGGAWVAHDRANRAYAADDLKGVRVYRSATAVPPWELNVTVTDAVNARRPKLVRDFRQRTWLQYATDAGTVERFSDDDGRTWSLESTIFEDAVESAFNTHPRTGLTLRLFLADGVVWATQQHRGDPEPRAAYALAGVELDDAGFHVSPAPEALSRWLLLGEKDSALAAYVSSDDGKTWKPA